MKRVLKMTIQEYKSSRDKIDVNGGFVCSRDLEINWDDIFPLILDTGYFFNGDINVLNKEVILSNYDVIKNTIVVETEELVNIVGLDYMLENNVLKNDIRKYKVFGIRVWARNMIDEDKGTYGYLQKEFFYDNKGWRDIITKVSC